MDTEVRALERRAACGDEEAREALKRARQRAGLLPPAEIPPALVDEDVLLAAMRDCFREDRDRFDTWARLGDEGLGFRLFGSPYLHSRRIVLRYELIRAGCGRCGTELRWFRIEEWKGPEFGFTCYCEETWESRDRVRRREPNAMPRVQTPWSLNRMLEEIRTPGRLDVHVWNAIMPHRASHWTGALRVAAMRAARDAGSPR